MARAGGVEVKAGSLHGLNGVLVFGTAEVTSYQGTAFSILSAPRSILVPSKLSATSLNDFRLLAEAVGKVYINCV